MSEAIAKRFRKTFNKKFKKQIEEKVKELAENKYKSLLEEKDKLIKFIARQRDIVFLIGIGLLISNIIFGIMWLCK